MQVLRTVFFLLVLGNLLLFARGQGYLGATAADGEAERLAAQIEPGKLRIVGNGAPPAGAAASPEVAPPAREACRALAGLERASADRLAVLLSGRDAQLQVTQRALDEPRSWWVHIPPLPNGALAEKKAAELAGLGVQDFYVVRTNGPNRHAISLGLYKSEESANARLKALGSKNVKSARIQVREAAGDKSVVEVRGTPQQLAKALAELPPEFSGLSDTDCAAARP
ncbi:MAG: SPOR domain-containing protein [Rhodocyclaceae bacterium]